MKSLRLRKAPNPVVSDSPEWTAITPSLSGICGSDLSLLKGLSSPYLAPLVSLPAVLGHEVVGRIDSPSAPWPVGTRVILDPSLACAARGLPLCPACGRGEPDECEARADAHLGAGLLLGYHHSLPGGWSNRLWAPIAQVIPIPDDLEDARAVLAEPASIVAEGLSRLRWDGIGTLLIIGAGAIGLLSTWLVRSQHPDIAVFVRSRHPHQSALAAELGASSIFDEGGDREFVQRPELDSIAGRLLPASFGGWPFRTGGFDAVIDSVGTELSLFQALTLARPGGQILLLGAAGRLRTDLTPLWSRRITLFGSFGYGHHPFSPPQKTFHDVIALLRQTPSPIERIVSHIVPLTKFWEAFDILATRQTGAIKVAFSNDLAMKA
nr:alcohol dehydrogenase catalytic domain-containing protein [Sulfobacillus harzensis]